MLLLKAKPLPHRNPSLTADFKTHTYQIRSVTRYSYMFVPSMTIKELRAEINKDFPIVLRKTNYIARKLEKLIKPNNKTNTTRFYTYQSKYKNQWIYRISIIGKEIYVGFITYYYGNRGLTAISVLPNDTLMYLTGHFFQRFNERLKLGLTLPEDIIREFMNQNTAFVSHKLEEVRPGVSKLFSVMPSGVMLGTHHKHLNYYRINTFITNAMLRGEQIARKQQLKDILDNYLDEHEGLGLTG